MCGSHFVFIRNLFTSVEVLKFSNSIFCFLFSKSNSFLISFKEFRPFSVSEYEFRSSFSMN